MSRKAWALIALGILLTGVVMFVAVRAWLHARSEAEALITELHTRMNGKDWNGIYYNADAVYQAQISSAEDEALFAAIHRKLGQVNRTSQQTTNLTVNNSGSYLTAQFSTEFAGDPHATETIVWRSLGGAYHLHSYSIQSLPLLTR